MNGSVMPTGPRHYRSATLMITPPTALPEHMRGRVRELTSLEVPQEDRRQGYATGLMHVVTTEADRSGIVLLIVAKAYAEGGISDAVQLQTFYERFGFVRIQEDPVLMARQPRASQIVRGVHRALAAVH